MQKKSRSKSRQSQRTVQTKDARNRSSHTHGNSNPVGTLFIAGGLLLLGTIAFVSLKFYASLAPEVEDRESAKSMSIETVVNLENTPENELEALLELPAVEPITPSVIDVEQWTRQVDQTIKILRDKYPQDAQVQHLAGLVHLRLKRTKAAEPDLRSAVALAPDNRQMRMDLADLLMQLGRDAEAMEILNSNSGATSPTSDFLVLLGECQQRLGQLSEAERSLSQACQLPSEAASRRAEVWQRLAKVQLQLQNYDNAANSIRRAVEVNSDDPENWLTMSRIYRLQKLSEDAQTALERWKQLTAQPIPTKENRAFELEHSQSMAKVFSSIYRSMASVHQSKNQTTAALESHQQALKVEPGDALALAGLASLHREQADFAAAVDANRQLLQLQPKEFAHYQNMANLAMELNRPDAAEAVLRLACFRMPENGNCHLILARFLLLLNKPSQAVRSAENAATILHNDEAAELLKRARQSAR